MNIYYFEKKEKEKMGNIVCLTSSMSGCNAQLSTLFLKNVPQPMDAWSGSDKSIYSFLEDRLFEDYVVFNRNGKYGIATQDVVGAFCCRMSGLTRFGQDNFRCLLRIERPEWDVQQFIKLYSQYAVCLHSEEDLLFQTKDGLVLYSVAESWKIALFKKAGFVWDKRGYWKAPKIDSIRCAAEEIIARTQYVVMDKFVPYELAENAGSGESEKVGTRIRPAPAEWFVNVVAGI